MPASPSPSASMFDHFPWEDAVDLIEAAHDADPSADIDKFIEDAAEWLDSAIDFSMMVRVGAAAEVFDQAVFESALKLLWKARSPEAMAKRKARRDERRAKRNDRKAARIAALSERRR